MVGAVGAYSVLGVLGLSQYVILGNNQQIMSNAPEKPGSPSRLNLYFISTEPHLIVSFSSVPWNELNTRKNISWNCHVEKFLLYV